MASGSELTQPNRAVQTTRLARSRSPTSVERCWRDPTWYLPAMLGLHDVPSAHSIPFVKQDRSTSRRYMRTAYCQNGEQVSRTVLTVCFKFVSRGPPGSWHAVVSARAILAYFLHLPTMKIGKRYSLGQSPKFATNAVEWRRVSRWLDRSVAYCEAVCVKRVTKPRHAHLRTDDNY